MLDLSRNHFGFLMTWLILFTSLFIICGAHGHLKGKSCRKWANGVKVDNSEKSFVEIGPVVPEKKNFEGFLPYMGMAAILVM